MEVQDILCQVIVSAFDVDTDRELSYGNMGELRVCSPSRMKEYYKNKKRQKLFLKLTQMERNGLVQMILGIWMKAARFLCWEEKTISLLHRMEPEFFCLKLRILYYRTQELKCVRS